MPLHPDTERHAIELDGLHDPAARVGRDQQPLPQFFDGLVVVALHRMGTGTDDRRDLRSVLHLDPVDFEDPVRSGVTLVPDHLGQVLM